MKIDTFVLFWVAVVVLLYSLTAQRMFVLGLKEVITFYFEKRMSFLQDLEKKVDGEIARSVFN